MGLKVEGANSFEGSSQLAQWEAILSGLSGYDFVIGSTIEGEKDYGVKYLQTFLQHSTGTYTLETSCIGWGGFPRNCCDEIGF